MRKICWLLAMSGLAGSAIGQVSSAPGGPPVLFCPSGEYLFTKSLIKVDTALDVSYEFHLNDCAFDSVIAGGAVQTIVNTLAVGPDSCPCVNFPPKSDADFAPLGDLLQSQGTCFNDPGRACASSSTTGCSGLDGDPPPGKANAWFNLGIFDGTIHADSSTIAWNASMCTEDNSCSPGTCIVLGVPVATTAPDITWNLDPSVPCGGIDFLVSIGAEVSITHTRDAWCSSCCQVTSNPSVVSLPISNDVEPSGGQFVSIEITGTDSNGMPYQDVHQGLITALSDESFVVNGIFSNAGLVVSPNGDGVRIAGNVPIAVSIPANVVDVRLSTVQFPFSKADGDVNSDMTINYTDFTLVVQALGTSLGMAGFDPRADMDGNLTIDNDDLALAQQISCIADVNGDGNIDQSDVDAWTALYDSGDPRAETDGVPGLNIFDVLTYLDMVGVGCD